MPGQSAAERARVIAPRHGEHRWVPPLPYVMLAALLCVGALGGALFAVLPSDLPHLRRIDAIGAAAYLAMAAAVWLLAPRVPGGWGLDGALLFTALSTLAALAFIDIESGRVLTGFVIVLFAVYAAYFLPRWRFLIELAVMLICYGVAVLAIGDPIPVMYYVIIVLVTASVGVFVSVLVSRLREEALTDSLTGLLNRRGLDLMSSYVASDAARKDIPVTVALVDLDGFKAYNDQHGHLAGDRRLAQMAEALALGLRGSDIVARFGGDEFAVLLPGATADDAHDLFDRIATDYPELAWSVGYCVWPRGEALDAALHAADLSLYAEKRAD